MTFNPLYILLAVLLAFGGGGYTGWELRGDHEAALQLEAKKVADEKLAKEVERGNKLASQLEEEKRNIKTVTVEVIKEVPKYTTVYVEKPGETPKAIPPAVYTWGAVSLYNRALRPDLPASASQFAYPAGATDLTRAPIDSPDVLNVHAENAAKYAECRAQLNKWIDWEEGRQRKAAE